MSPRARVYLLVAAAAVAVAGATVGATALYHDPPTSASRARAGAPPLLLDLGTRTDGEAREFRRAAQLYNDGEREQARVLFDRSRDVEARVGSALARWPAASTRRLEALAREHPRSGLVRLHVGLARFWEGRADEAVEAWEEAERVQPDSQSAVWAEDLRHPEFARGLPTFVPSFGVTDADRRRGGQRGLLARGVAFQRLGKRLSARRAFDAAARARGDWTLDARVAGAVARFDKDDPSLAFGRLGPLSKAHPRAAVVRYHLGLLLLWTGRVDPAKRQLRLAQSAQPRSLHAREAKRLLNRLENVS